MIDKKIIEYIKSFLSQGKSKEDIYKELLNQGWTVDNIQGSFDYIGAGKEKDGEETHKRTIRIIVAIGAILVGAGVFSFVAANWQEMTKSARVAVIVASMLISYSAGWYLKEKLNLPKTGGALILLGSIIYGAGIFLVAQMFNIRANWPDGFILWMIGVIIMAYAADLFSLFYLAIPLGVVSLAGHPFEIFASFMRGPFLLTSSFLLLAAAIITFATGLFVRKKIPRELKEFY
ncbi:MAG: hypothetical protein A2909_01140 [Candidatus Tagabacteria bacterium RIFCSPLOWO2_01_FULL_39_11]|uniref:DUF2157 domain-containing protein n=1 Tax=Candidatus Tagabacteria bacterium RIFCSPLOWO2_01_FULL_39_11 TaxID=1802295 RepID=A0A1G2LRQ4_9BACT|nr:MAG: hypothetical protein A2909_01140 [Candidatus Tagabacteria bacterium RIFCSPLOWO2_01_FULL_39_11]